MRVQKYEGLVARPSGGISLERLRNPVLRKGEALLRVRNAGICGTDLAIISGSYKIAKPIVLGHEIVGEIEQANGASKRMSPGTRVTTEINVGCGLCPRCAIGLRNHCANIETMGITRNGGFAEYVSTPIENLHKVPDSMSNEKAVFIEPLAAAIQLTKMADIRKGSNCAVVGAGRLGLLILGVLSLRSPKHLVAVVHHGAGEEKRSRLARSFGGDAVSSSINPKTLVQTFTNGVGFDHVVEATGNPAGFRTALKLVRPRGTIHLKSTHGLSANVDLTEVAVREIRIQGSRCGPFDESIRMISEGMIPVEKLVFARFRLMDYKRAFREAAKKDVVKAIFEV